MINVTKTYLPSKDKYKAYVDQIFESGVVTNNGPLVRKLEERLCEYLGVRHVVLVANGTAALEVAYRTLGLKGEVITTPFSFVATTSSLVTNNIRPIFSDINPETLNIDASKISERVSKCTSAILPVHVFGNVCEIQAIDEIARKYKLKVIYDAAHAFGVKYNNESVLNYGDISTVSFHATKLFHTIEGGALIINDDNLVEKARYLINFGIQNEESIPELGTNAKMNEFEAAMGLCVLDEIDTIYSQRKTAYERYYQYFNGIVNLQKNNGENVTLNYSYFPVIFESEEQCLRVKHALNEQGINPRRYFYPSLDSLTYISQHEKCLISRDISSKILCLPIFPGLSKDEQMKIINIVMGAL